MTFLDNLQSHKGGLIRLKTELFWYGGRGCDKDPGRVCLILDAAGADSAGALAATTATTGTAAAALLLIDGQPQWVWVAERDIYLLVNDPPTN